MDTTTLAPSTGSTATTTATTSASSQKALSSDFTTFLKMLTVQMQNQDPLDPVDSADYAVQLATFSGVEQQVKTNDLLGSISGQLTLSGLSDMAGWVGRQVRAAMPAWFDGAPVTVSPNPLALADGAELVVRDAQGKEVDRQAIPVSSDPIEWAGVGADGSPMASGLYSFEVVSTSGGEEVSTDPAEVYGTVTEVRAVDGKAVLVTQGGSMVAADSVTALRMGS
ncbi:Flagellar basal-body rod modification protein FlgD [Rubellimicrobium mesophilum DSM 19309]|uniref:Basal-body rod modification protein FlgD n=1 Tax=Rubellimicrobium mesophilum DSM 19309 TaxID=442562 RepID=A0A017HJB5_9RHOB|nr:flagellar hook capping FlgD N-terminal domain-containing protein [Rubellimicrobium mesophilum]EYD73884.1 Flagellar basal-body rod modification protein FlgD [Rubellimicrobium mesophilum DSM 19309]